RRSSRESRAPPAPPDRDRGGPLAGRTRAREAPTAPRYHTPRSARAIPACHVVVLTPDPTAGSPQVSGKSGARWWPWWRNRRGGAESRGRAEAMSGRSGPRWVVIGALGVVGILVAGTDAFAGTYRWVDRDGNVRYTDRPPQADEVAP